MATVPETAKRSLNSRLETVASGLFLVMVGGLLLLPTEYVPTGAWAFGVGLIMLGLNLVRYLNGIVVSHFSVGLGVLALIGGVADYLGAGVPIIPLIIALIGGEVIISALRKK